MCFSVEVDKNIKRLAKQFAAKPLAHEFFALKNMQAYEKSQGPEKIKELLGLKRRPNSSIFKIPEEDSRVYPNYFAPVITIEKGQRILRPMRYRVRPSHSTEEIPSKYNVFNARIDSLEKRKTWSNIFMKNHGLFPFIKFYEWVEDENSRKKLINFSPGNYETMWAPCLYDKWESKDKNISFYSFALITDAPPPEIEERGHDRCPIFLREDQINEWLTPENSSKQRIYQLLQLTQTVHYQWVWAS